MPQQHLKKQKQNPPSPATQRELVCDIFSDILTLTTTTTTAASNNNNKNHIKTGLSSVEATESAIKSSSSSEVIEEEISARKRIMIVQDEEAEDVRLSFPQIWVESFCDSSDDDEDEAADDGRIGMLTSSPSPTRVRPATASPLSSVVKTSSVNRSRSAKDKVLRSLVLASCSSTDVSFDRSLSLSSCASSRQNSFQLSSSNENSVDLGGLLDQASSSSSTADSAAARRGRSESEDSCCVHSTTTAPPPPPSTISFRHELQTEEEAFSPQSSSSLQLRTHQQRLPSPDEEEEEGGEQQQQQQHGLRRERQLGSISFSAFVVEASAAASPPDSASRQQSDGRAEPRTPVASTIRDWLGPLETNGFHPQVLRSFAKEPKDDDDETWFETGLVRVFDPYYDIGPEEVLEVEGKTDPKTGEPVGRCTLKLRNGDEVFGTFRNGLRHGRGSIEGDNLLQHGIHHLRGFYRDSILIGEGRAVLPPNSLWSLPHSMNLEGIFNDGYLEGPVRGVDEKGCLVFAGSFSRGLPVGACWLAKEGQGWLYGQVDHKGRFTGDEIVFLYPDLSTCLLGKFEDGVMKEAVEARVASADLDQDAKILVLSVDACNGIDEDDDLDNFSFNPSDNVSIRCDWKLPDCYESTTVECKESSISGAGEGLFARKDLPPKTIVAYYNGLKVMPEQNYAPMNFNYQIYVDWGNTDQSPYIDIPSECVDSSVYVASLAHKANHSFTPNCQYVAVDHPRFGRIPALKTLRHVEKGEELFSHYKYDMALAPNWYTEAYEAFSAAMAATTATKEEEEANSTMANQEDTEKDI